jgi:hypothetical protein
MAKSMDNASSFQGATLGGTAQNWLDLEAEYARSNFDQRHQVVATFEYTTGAGILGGTLLDGWKGRLFKDWTVTSQVTTGSGQPITPSYFSPLRGTGITGATRPSLTGEALKTSEDNRYVNPLAFSVPASGEWGTAPRNAFNGPSQFSMNASVTRTFRIGERINMDWRMDATNVLNRVTFAGINNSISASQFGFANRTNDMRKLRTSFRFRF